MLKITCWYRQTKTGYKYNHFSNGWSSDCNPIPKFESQSGWDNEQWLKDHCYLVNNEVIRDCDE